MEDEDLINNPDVRVTKIKRMQKNGVTYVLNQYYYYDKEKGYNRTIKTILIGKILPGTTEMIKTRPKKPSKSPTSETTTDLVPVQASRKNVGMMKIIEHIGKISGIDETIMKSMEEGIALKTLSVARYIFATGGMGLSGLENWQYTHNLPYQDGISEDVYHNLFFDIGNEEAYQERFFFEWCKQFDETDSIAYDSTTQSTYSENISDAQYGYNKDQDGLKTIKILTLYSINKRLPLIFSKQPGYISDVTSIKNMLIQMKALEINVSEVVTDNGYYSENNMAEMIQNNVSFITLAKSSLKWIHPYLENKGEEIDKFSNAYPKNTNIHGITIPITKTFEKVLMDEPEKKESKNGETETFEQSILLHLYFDRNRQNEEITSFETNLMELKQFIESDNNMDELSSESKKIVKKYMEIKEENGKKVVLINEEEVAKERKNFGYFALVSNNNNDTFDCLEKYRKREYIEEFFKKWSQSADGSRPGVSNTITLKGKLFVQFIALCYREYFENMIQELKMSLKTDIENPNEISAVQLKNEKSLLNWMNERTTLQQLQWFDMTEEVTITTPLHRKRWDTEVTVRDRLYLEKLGVTLE